MSFDQMNMLAPGQMPMMGGPQGGPNTQFPLNGQPQNALNMPVRPDRPQFDMTAIRGALQGMPQGQYMQAFQSGNMTGMPQAAQDAYGQFQGYRDAMGQYRTDMHDYHQQMHGTPDMGHFGKGPMMTPGGGGGTGPIPGQPGMPNTQFPTNPGFAAPGVGQSMNVQGMTPGTGQYGMPVY